MLVKIGVALGLLGGGRGGTTDTGHRAGRRVHQFMMQFLFRVMK